MLGIHHYFVLSFIALLLSPTKNPATASFPSSRSSCSPSSATTTEPPPLTITSFDLVAFSRSDHTINLFVYNDR
ncbi:hypothetical protein BJX68DRAFT_212215 [Aspergillus pseudodeflectus]|uniref:Uncharacterized protein n=1 Tax=Aspergillus pseudodeflectus TaxID=176178 RepID=A0ABR4JEM2_9EURO